MASRCSSMVQAEPAGEGGEAGGTRAGRLHWLALSEGCGVECLRPAGARGLRMLLAKSSVLPFTAIRPHRHGHACRGELPRDRFRGRAHRPRARRRSSAPSWTTCSTCRASSRPWPRKRDYYWRSPTRCATACCSAGSARPRPTRKQRSRTVAYLSAEFLIGPHLGNNLINLGIYDAGAAGRSRELGLDFDELLAAGGGARPGQRRPGTAGRLLPRFAGHAARSRRSATASATSSASSTRRSSTAGRSSAPTSGCASAIPGRSRGPSGRSR